jgi:hypothetical protein
MTATEVKPIDLTDWAEAIYQARAEEKTCVVATSDLQGRPDIGFKGSMMVWDKDHLAFWDRSHGTHLDNLRQNPRIGVIFRNPERKVNNLRLFGVAELHPSGELRDQVWERVNELEKPTDPERKGIAVLVRVDRVFMARNLIQARPGVEW